MRSILLRMTVLVGAIALWCGAWVYVRATGPDAMIAPLLPQGEGTSACFAGTYTEQAMDIENWSKLRHEPTGRLSPDGHPYTRPVPAVDKGKAIQSFTLQLLYDTRKSHYDWIYNFRLLANVDGIGTLYGAGECPWYATDKRDGGYAWSANTTGLGCGIDCDGGGFGVERVVGTPSLRLSFDPRVGLKMKGGCGGYGIYRLMPTSSGSDFRLEPARPEACKPLEEIAGR